MTAPKIDLEKIERLRKEKRISKAKMAKFLGLARRPRLLSKILPALGGFRWAMCKDQISPWPSKSFEGIPLRI